MKKPKKRDLEKIIVDRKIVEGLRSGRSLTQLTKSTGKGKGYVIKVRDLALDYGYIEIVDASAPTSNADLKSFKRRCDWTFSLDIRSRVKSLKTKFQP